MSRLLARRPPLLAMALRGLAILCALAALSGMRPSLPSSRRLLVILFDASASVGAKEIERGRRIASQLVSGLPPRAQVAAFAFGADCRRILPPSPRDEALASLDGLTIAAEAGSTNIALALAAARLEAGAFRGGTEILLLGDGRTNAGALAEGSPSLPIHVLPLGEEAGHISALGLSLPPQAALGQSVLARWTLHSEEESEIEWSLSLDGKEGPRARAKLMSGDNGIEVPIKAEAEGFREILLSAWDSQGQPIPAAEQGGILRVSGPSSVLVVSSEPSPLVEALAAQGFAAAQGLPSTLPDKSQGYASLSAVVLDNLSATELTRQQMTALRSWTASGGGLLVLGGLKSLGRGEYWDSPLEDCIPVETDTRQRRFFNRAQILYVIDHSSSMMDAVGGTTKVMAALQGVARSVQELNPLDEVGIMGFGSEIQWLLPFTPADQTAKITGALSGLADGGGTDMALAFSEIIRTFAIPAPVKRHVILLTDGQTLKADFKSLSSRLKSLGVTVTTIGIGADVDEKLLSDIAGWNDGRYYRAADDKIPEIVDKETVRIGRDLIQEGSYRLIRGDASPITEGLGPESPAVRGYLITRPKALATVLLSLSAQSGSSDPLLALWRYGAGKAAVFSSDSGALWLRDWAGKSEYNRLWAQILREIARAPMDGGLSARALWEGSGARVIVEALDQEGRLRTGAVLEGRGSGGGPFSLRETAPGRYEGFAYLEGTGLHQLEISDPAGGGWTATWAWVPAGIELARTGVDAEALSRLAASSGGLSLDPAGPWKLPGPGISWASFDLALPLAILSLALFLAELAWRSLFLGQLSLARAAFLNWRDRENDAARRIRLAALDADRHGAGPDAAESPVQRDAYRRLAESVRESRKRKKATSEGGRQ